MEIVFLYLFIIFSHVQFGSNALPQRIWKDLETPRVDKRETKYINRVKRSSARVEGCIEETVEETVKRKTCKIIFAKFKLCKEVPVIERKVIQKCF